MYMLKITINYKSSGKESALSSFITVTEFTRTSSDRLISRNFTWVIIFAVC
jgi:hypothetical protein